MKKPSFNLIFSTVLALTLSSGGAAFHLASQPSLTEAQNRLLDSALAMWTMGATTMVGLLSVGASGNDKP